LVPKLAVSETASANEKTFTVTLRHGLKFSDGSPLDGTAVVAHYKRLVSDPQVQVPPELPQVKLSARGNVVTFIAPTPWSTFPQDVLSGHLSMIGSAAAEIANPSRFGQYPVGDGPFKVKSYVSGSEVVLTRNPNYWDGSSVHLNTITFKFLTQDQTRLASLTSGGIDLMASSDVTQVAQAKSGGLQTQVNVGNGPVAIFLNTAKSVVGSKAIRVALAQAINSKGISTVVYKGLSPVATGYLAPKSPSAEGSASPSYNPAAARKAIAAAGKKISITLTTTPAFVNTAQLVQQMWQAVGVNVTIQQLDSAQAGTLVYVQKGYEAFLSNYSPPAPSNAQPFSIFLGTGSGNVTNLADPELAAAYSAALAAHGDTEQVSSWKKVERIAVGDLASVPLVQNVGMFAWSKKVHGVPAADPFGVQIFNVSHLWVSP
jgi:ABC-type transport system substrate-binding protein